MFYLITIGLFSLRCLTSLPVDRVKNFDYTPHKCYFPEIVMYYIPKATDEEQQNALGHQMFNNRTDLSMPVFANYMLCVGLF